MADRGRGATEFATPGREILEAATPIQRINISRRQPTAAMRIFLSGTPRDLIHAEEWVNNPDLVGMLDDLHLAIDQAEQRWGSCAVFIECVLSGVNKLKCRQTDLLIAFSERVALCELKQDRKLAPDRVDNAATQIGQQKELLVQHLRQAHINPDSVFCFLWTPHLGRAQLSQVFENLRGEHNHLRHITPAGSQAALRGFKLKGIPAYLPDAMVTMLGYAPVGLQLRSAQPKVSTVLSEVVQHGYAATGTPLLEFATLRAVREYLRSGFPRENIELVLDSTHVSGLRKDSLDAASCCLNKERFIEIAGPQGVGKSTFIKELLVQILNSQGSHYSLSTVILQRKESVRTILQSIATEAGFIADDRIDILAEERLFRELADREYVYWIKDYDRASYEAVMVLGQLLRQSATSSTALWIVESMSSAPTRETEDRSDRWKLTLASLDNDALATIVRRYRPGSDNPDINAIISAAQGIPHLAIRRWTVPNPERLPKSSRLDQYDLFLYHLNPEERSVVKAIAYILLESPFGTTLKLIEEWCQTILHLRVEDSRRVARAVVDKAREWRLISVEVFGSDHLGEAGNAEALMTAWKSEGGAEDLAGVLLPRRVQTCMVGWVRVLDPHFVDHFVRKIGDTEKSQWQERLGRVLIAGLQHDLSLTGVTFSILNGDFEAFARSSFRSSSAAIPNVAVWLDRRGDLWAQDDEPNAAYFRQWIWWLRDHYWDHEGSARWRLDPPDEREPLQMLLYDTIRVRSQVYRRQDLGCDWDAWSQTAEEFWRLGKFDLWAEALLRQAQTWLRSPFNEPVKAWELMRRVLDQDQRLSREAGRSQMCFHVLSFLNKRKLWVSHIPSLESQARVLVPNLVRMMVADGLAMENVTTIANALFFFARTIEVQQRPTTAAEVAGYSAIMRFVERVSPARRIQALLTQGSIHRHYCSQDGLEWADFREHAEQALAAYERVIDAAGPAGMDTHAMSALSYVGVILVKAMRFAPDAELKGWLRSRLPQSIPKLERLMRRLVESSEAQPGRLDRQLASSLNRHLAIQKWLFALLANPAVVDELPALIQAAAHSMEENSGGLAWQVKVKNYNVALGDINRVISFTETELLQARAIIACAAPLFDLLTQTSYILPIGAKSRLKSPLRKEGAKLLRVLDQARVKIPDELRAAFGVNREDGPLVSRT